MSRAAALGFTVSRPHAASAPYDVIIEKDGHVWLVQVKSAAHSLRGAYIVHTAVNARVRRPYLRRDTDFIAVHIAPLDVWYIIPVGAARKTTLTLRPRLPRWGRFNIERYREAWALLEGFGRRRKCWRQHTACRRFTLYRA